MPLISPKHQFSAVPDIASNNFRRTTTFQLLPPIGNVIPSCAQSCLASFISDGYSSSVCPDLSDLFCLCSHYDNGGFTLGEGALSCVNLSCSASTTTDLNNAYDICNTQSNYVTPTHQTLSITAVLSSLPTSALSSSRGRSSTSSGLSSSPSSTMTSAVETPMPTNSPTPPVAASSAPAPAETVTAASHQGLTTAQIAGIAVAAVASLVLVAGAIVLISFCVRRRRLQTVEEATTPSTRNGPVDGARPEKVSPSNPIQYPPTVTKDPRKGYGGVGITRASQYRTAKEQQSSVSKPKDVSPEAIGVAISPVGYDNDTPTSYTSVGTMSQLLPKKPEAVNQQHPTANRPASNFSQATVFEEDNPATGRRVEDFIFPVPPSPIYSRYPRENPPVRIATDLSSTPGKKQPPPLTLDIPPTALKSNTATIGPPRIVAMAQPTTTRSMMPSKYKRRSRTIPQNREQTNLPPGHELSQADDGVISTRNAAPAGTDPQPGSNEGKHASDQTVLESGRNSCTSDTSFESLGDDPTPPEEVLKRLSPVEESPISSIRYPKIPRSSNQVVPRRSPTGAQFAAGAPRSESPSLWRPNISRLDDGTDSSRSSSTLLMKRRGEKAAMEIERHLGLPQSYADPSSGGSSNPHTPRTASSSNTLGPAALPCQLTGWRQSRFANNLRNRVPESASGREVTWIEDSAISPTTVLRSPLWEPRLTPTRKGDDLMLSVS